MASQIDYSPLLQPTPQSGAARGLTHLGTVLDAIMERKSREEAERVRLAQAAAIAAEDDKRQRDQLNWTMKHQGAEEDIAREKNAADERNQTANRALQALHPFEDAAKEGDIEGMKRWGAPGGIEMKERPQTPAMDLLGALTDKPAPADPLGAPPPMGYTPMGEVQAPAGVVPPPEPPASPSLLEAQLASPKPPTYDVTVPGGPSTVYDPAAIRTRRMEQGAKLAQDLAGIAGDSPFDQRAQADVQRMANSGAVKTRDQVLQEYVKQKNFYELQAEENKRNAVSAAAQRDKLSLTHPAGERDVPTLEGGKAGQAATTAEAEKIRAAQPAVKSLLGALSSLKQTIAGAGEIPYVGGSKVNVPFTQVNKEMGQRQKYAASFLTKIFETGVMSDAEFKRYQDMMSPALWQSPQEAQDTLDLMISDLTSWYQNKLSAQGIKMAPADAAGGKAKPSAKSIVGKMGIE